jgi:DNA-binding CsgD family transcriptional regulator
VTGDKSAFRISDFLGDLEWQERALYHEFFRPLGLKYQVCHFFEGTAAQIGFALNRQTRDFSNEERALLGIMAGHLRQAHQRVVAFTRARQSFAGEGIVDVDAEGRIQFFTEKAQALISLYFPNPGRSSHAMPEDVLRWFRHSAGYSNLGEHFAVMAPFTISREGWILVIRLASSPGKENHQLLLEEKSAGTSSRSLEALGLTPREAEVLLWVSQGKTNAEIAIILGAATGTIRKHVQNLLRKLCVETRTAAAAMALNLGYR